MMKLANSFLLLVAASFGVPTAAFADDQTIVSEYFAPWSAPREQANLRHLATCVAERHSGAARAFVRQMGHEKELRARSEQLIDNKCIRMFWFKNSTTRIEASVYFLALAEALLKQEYPAGSLPSTVSVGPLEHPSLPDVAIETVHPHYRDMFVVSRAVAQLQALGECTARVEPDRVLALAQTEPGSPKEREAFSALDSALSACGGGVLPYSYPAFMKRGALVANLYRLVDAARLAVRSEPAV